MAKVTGALFSTTASGNLKKTIVFSTSKGVQTVKGNRLEKVSEYHFKSKKVVSETIGQKAIRGTFKQAICNWKNMSEEEKQVYINQAKGKPLTAISLYVKEYIRDSYDKLYFTKAWLMGFGLGYPLFLFTCGNKEQYMFSKLKGK